MLLAILARTGTRRKQLVRDLAAIGVQTTESAIANRIHRGSLSFAFVLQVARALKLKQLELDSDPVARNPSLRAERPPDDRI